MTADNPPTVDWQQLEILAQEAAKPGVGPGAISEARWQIVGQSLQQLVAAEAWDDILRMRQVFTALFARDTAWGLSELRDLDDAAIEAARKTKNNTELAHLLGARGHNLHREGRHEKAIEAFSEARVINLSQGRSFDGVKNQFMTALCYRALGQEQLARDILNQVLEQIAEDDPWRGQPLQVLAWLTQDAGDLKEAERLHREALNRHRLLPESDILVAGTLVDLAEVIGFQNRPDEADDYFLQSLAILNQHARQYDRQEARTRLKYAEFLQRRGTFNEALGELNKADDLVSRYGHYYDLLWRIELTRAVIFLKQKRFSAALRKSRSTLRYRRQLGLSNLLLIKQLVRRALSGTGLPR